MITKFKIGYYYKFIGDKDHYFWNEDRKLILDRKWYKCIDIGKKISKKYNPAKFEGMEYDWAWYNKDFIESKCNPYVKKLLKETK